jgi:uncharacterized protein YdeI (YjbR/CyaY-like superfamily)
MPKPPPSDLPILAFAGPRDWAAWLAKHHAASPGIWLQLAKKASGTPSITYAEAIDGALCHGWIDGQRRSHDAGSFLLRMVPRRADSVWSKINRERADWLRAQGSMKPAGEEAIRRAKSAGRWDGAYDPPSKSKVPADLEAALAARPKAQAFFATLNAQNRYSILFRVQTAKKPETRARRIAEFVKMMAAGKKIYP